MADLQVTPGIVDVVFGQSMTIPEGEFLVEIQSGPDLEVGEPVTISFAADGSGAGKVQCGAGKAIALRVATCEVTIDSAASGFYSVTAKPKKTGPERVQGKAFEVKRTL
ncbi:MAG: hypothetical protein AAF739_09595 [Pseudomonadota bacterium]